MLSNIKAYFGFGVGLSLVVSLLFNYSQSQVNENLSTQLITSNLSVKSLTAKNQALDNQMQALLLDRDVAQQAADENQREVLKLRRDALVKVKEVRTVIQHEDCYSRPLPDNVIKRMHYN
ncbi:DUF2570 family protein [Photobacterium lipolyticum]|uniref:DUF2570 domain-containing protein n=1 Tax=Photobacterium lipolyticum TaxID=266810 RepID=A0A2T3N1J5_9GAMM|nr:DUF2570 family protein [Photobacterium lipolyticum]PSW06172.1 hypothetical protein C9I89_06590 [Photobacterium lipolyticum]